MSLVQYFHFGTLRALHKRKLVIAGMRLAASRRFSADKGINNNETMPNINISSVLPDLYPKKLGDILDLEQICEHFYKKSAAAETPSNNSDCSNNLETLQKMYVLS